MLDSILAVKSTIASWDKALVTAAQLNQTLLPIESKSSTPFVLLFEYTGVRLLDIREKKPIELKVDFAGGSAQHRRKFGGGNGQAIAKAIGLKGSRSLRVLDATAGLGGDAFVLASLGCSVTMFERSPIAYALLSDGLLRAREFSQEHSEQELMDTIDRLQLVTADSTHDMAQAFENAQKNKQPDVIYLDPMFPEKNKKALAKKEMQFFQMLIGDDIDADGLLPQALALAQYRVVVKRPKKSPYLNDVEPTLQLVGKSSRFDIYTKKKLP